MFKFFNRKQRDYEEAHIAWKRRVENELNNQRYLKAHYHFAGLYATNCLTIEFRALNEIIEKGMEIYRKKILASLDDERKPLKESKLEDKHFYKIIVRDDLSGKQDWAMNPIILYRCGLWLKDYRTFLTWRFIPSEFLYKAFGQYVLSRGDSRGYDKCDIEGLSKIPQTYNSRTNTIYVDGLDVAPFDPHVRNILDYFIDAEERIIKY